MTDEQRVEYMAKLLGGYTQEQLQVAFNQVVNPDDWRAPICARVPLDKFNGPLIKFAIEFYTATMPTFVACGDKILVTADGYRKGPAGDH